MQEVGLLHPTEAPSTTADVDPPLNTSSSPAPPTNTKNNPQATAPTEADHATESSAFTPESPENPSDKGNGKSSIAYIVGGVVAVVLICMAAMYMVFIFEQHRQRSQSAKETKVWKINTFRLPVLCCMQNFPLYLSHAHIYKQMLLYRVVSTGAFSVHRELLPTLDFFRTVTR